MNCLKNRLPKDFKIPGLTVEDLKNATEQANKQCVTIDEYLKMITKPTRKSKRQFKKLGIKELGDKQ